MNFNFDTKGFHYINVLLKVPSNKEGSLALSKTETAGGGELGLSLEKEKSHSEIF